MKSLIVMDCQSNCINLPILYLHITRMLAPIKDNYKPRIPILADIMLCFTYSKELEERHWSSVCKTAIRKQ